MRLAILIKRLFYQVLCNPVTGTVITKLFGNKIPNLRNPRERWYVTDSGMSRSIMASIFFGFYEAAEIRFVKKYFDGSIDAIELGSSCGIVSSHIISKFKEPERKYIGVEANKLLAKAFWQNSKRGNKSAALMRLLNVAVDYSGASVLFSFSENTTASKVVVEGSIVSERAQQVPSMTLDAIVRENNVNKFALFCDIEGAEIQILSLETEVWEHCMQIFIELHETDYCQKRHTVEMLHRMVIQKGYSLVDKNGPVRHYLRKI